MAASGKLKALRLLLKEITDPYVQENFYKLKLYLDSLEVQVSSGVPGPQGPQGPIGPVGSTIAEVCELLELETNSSAYTTIKSIPSTNNSALRVRVELVHRKADNAHRASFQRTALYWNSGGTLTLEKQPHSDHTLSSDKQIDLRFQISGGDILVQVRAFNSDTAYWRGRCCTLELTTV